MQKRLFLLMFVWLIGGCVPNQVSSYLKKHQTSGAFTSSTIPKVYAVSENLYRFQTKQQKLWDSTISVLSKNYAFKKINIHAKSLETDWDYFQFEGLSYRNKLNIRIKKLGHQITQMKITNFVQEKDSNDQWQRTNKPKVTLSEIGRVIQNSAIDVGAPEPKFPQSIKVAMQR